MMTRVRDKLGELWLEIEAFAEPLNTGDERVAQTCQMLLVKSSSQAYPIGLVCLPARCRRSGPKPRKMPLAHTLGGFRPLGQSEGCGSALQAGRQAGSLPARVECVDQDRTETIQRLMHAWPTHIEYPAKLGRTSLI